MEEDRDQWIVVRKRKRKFIEKEYKPEKIQYKGGKQPFQQQFTDSIKQRFINDQNIQYNSSLLEQFLKNLKYPQVEVNCLGLGNFKAHLKSQLQYLYLTSCILPFLKRQSIKFSLNCYDPIFTQQQVNQLSSFSRTKQLSNLSTNITHIVYMPHCDRFLYEKVCEMANLQQMSIIIIGNSIQQYKQRCHLLNQPIPEPFISITKQQTKLKDYLQAFNDTFIYLL